jgi:putative FmdB family regulatory protein
MPKFDFFCTECGLLFDKLVQDANTKEVECKSCQSVARKHYKPHSVGVTYKGGVPPTPEIDQLVGADAEKRWSRVGQLHDQANAIRRESNNPVVEVSGSGELKAASKETVETRKSVVDTVVDSK